MSRRGLYWIGVLAALCATVGGAVVAYTGWVSASGPAGAVRAYFDAVQRGDAAGALGWGDVPTAARSMVSESVLGVQRGVAPIEDFGVVAVNRTERTRATVAVVYTLRFAAEDVHVTDTVDVVRRDRRWRLAKSAIPVRVDILRAEHRASLAGDAIPDEPVLLFPGPLPLRFDTPLLAVQPKTAHVRFAGPPSVTADVQVAPKASDTIAKAVAAAVDACLTAKPPFPACPMPTGSERAVPGTLRGQRAGDPSLSLGVPVTPAGLVEVSGTVQVKGAWKSLTFDNIAVDKSGTVTADLAAVAYPGDPVRIVWKVTT